MAAQAARHLSRSGVKDAYKAAIRAAKRVGITATLYKVGAEEVTATLDLQAGMVLGVEAGGVSFADMVYPHSTKVQERQEDGTYVPREIIVDYKLRSQQRDGRCSLYIKDGINNHPVAEVAK